MAEAQLMEEQLQQSVLLSELDDAVGDEDVSMGNDAAFAANSEIHAGATAQSGDEDEDMIDAEDDGEHSEDEEEDDDENEFGEDDDGEEDEEGTAVSRPQRSRPAKQSSVEEDEDEDEGVGAVKFKPGETDDEESSSNSSDEFESASGVESEGEWDDTKVAEHEEDEESENGRPNLCVFCKQDEEHDPAEDFETFLACNSCGDNGEPLKTSRYLTRANVQQHINSVPVKPGHSRAKKVSFVSWVDGTQANVTRCRELEVH